MTPPPPDPDRPRAITEQDVDALVNRFVEHLTDADTAERITNAWTSAIDRAIGRGIRRLAAAVVFALLLLGAVKLDVLSRLFGGK